MPLTKWPHEYLVSPFLKIQTEFTERQLTTKELFLQAPAAQQAGVHKSFLFCRVAPEHLLLLTPLDTCLEGFKPHLSSSHADVLHLR